MRSFEASNRPPVAQVSMLYHVAQRGVDEVAQLVAPARGIREDHAAKRGEFEPIDLERVGAVGPAQACSRLLRSE